MARYSGLAAMVTAVFVVMGGVLAHAQTMQQLSADVSALVQNVTPSIVSLKADRPFPDLVGIPYRNTPRPVMRALGTGFVVESGYVVTSDTVVANAVAIQVTFSDGSSVKGTLVGSDPVTNMALVRVEKTGVKPLALGDSDAVKPGAIVVSVNNRNGRTNMVSLGVVSDNKARLSTLTTDLLQISGDIGPGASGGPVFDPSGKVIGMTIAMIGDASRSSSSWEELDGKTVGMARVQPLSPSEPSTPIVVRRPKADQNDQGYVFGSGRNSASAGYAVPSNTIKTILAALKAGKEIERGYLGMHVADRDGKLLVLEIVPDGPAAKAGVKTGDIIVNLNGKMFETADRFGEYVADLKPGQKVKLRVTRDGNQVDLVATLTKRPALSAQNKTDHATRDAAKQMDDLMMGGGIPLFPDFKVPRSMWGTTSSSGAIYVENGTIQEVARALSEAYKVNVVAMDPDKISRRALIHLNPATISIDRALEAICSGFRCSYRKEGSTYIIEATEK